MTAEMQKEMRLGNILVQLGLMSDVDLSEASQLAVELGLPLGKVLVMSDFLTEPQLGAIVQAQSMLKDHLIDLTVARRAIDIVTVNNVDWAEGLQLAGWIEPTILPTNKLGKLLLEAGIIDEALLGQALANASESGLPLGRILSASGRVSEQLLVSCLNAQVLLRDNKINRDQAIKALKAAATRQTSIEQALIEAGEYQPPAKVRIKLGEIFVLAKLLSEDLMIDIIERGLVSEEPIGQVLVKAGLITPEQLEVALQLQQMVDGGSINPIMCVEALHQVCLRGISVQQALQEQQQPKEQTAPQLSLADLLKVAGILSEEDMTEAFRRSIQNPEILGRILVMTGMVSELGIQVALQCQMMIKAGALREDQALIALNYCTRMQVSFEQAAVDLGWTEGVMNKRRKSAQEEQASTAAKAALQFFD